MNTRSRNEHKLVLEHARLAAELGVDKQNEPRIRARLEEIEQELQLTRHQIAEEALKYY